jgi:hypothetical protein
MDDDFIILAYVCIEEMLKLWGHQSHVLAEVSDAEVLTVAVVASKHFRGNLEISLSLMKGMGYIRGKLGISRFNRRIHALAGYLEQVLMSLVELYQTGRCYIVDSLPVPVCKRARARRCKKVRGAAFCGYCAAKKEKFFGWRLHLICTPQPVPVSFALVEGAHHDLTAIHELAFVLPDGSLVYADKGFNSAADELSLEHDTYVFLTPIRKKNMVPNSIREMFALAKYRRQIETLGSQLENMGIQHIRATTNLGFFLKLYSALLALVFTNM